jgi:hypothetical protein
VGVLPEYARAVCRQQTFVAASNATNGGWAQVIDEVFLPLVDGRSPNARGDRGKPINRS